MIYAINAYDPGNSSFVLLLEGVRVMTQEEVIDAVHMACEEYFKTPDGRADLESTGGEWNWGDFDQRVPDEICERHGFRKLYGDEAIVVDTIFDHSFVD